VVETVSATLLLFMHGALSEQSPLTKRMTSMVTLLGVGAALAMWGVVRRRNRKVA